MSFSSRFSEIKFNLSSVLLLDSFIELIRVRVFSQERAPEILSKGILHSGQFGRILHWIRANHHPVTGNEFYKISTFSLHTSRFEPLGGASVFSE